MTKKELVSALAEKTGFTKKDAECALNATLEIIATELASGNEVQLSGFGTFSVKTRAPRDGFHPQTGESIQIGESKTPSFKAGKNLKDTVSQ